LPAPIDETRVYEAVVALWRKLGFEAASTRKISEAAGIAEVTLYRRFGSKEKLFVEAFRHQARLLTKETPSPSGNIQSDLIELVKSYKDLMSRLGPIVMEVMSGSLKPPLLKKLKPIAGQGLKGIEQCLGHYQALGELRPAKTSELMLLLIGPILANLMLSQAGMAKGIDLDLKEHVSQFLRANRSLRN
jgi:AcrR family transcriptional regulator